MYVLTEGQTEQAFVRELLVPSLSAHGIYLHEILVGKPGRKGGIRTFDAVKGDIKRLLKQDRSAKVTTLFDRYALPTDWPGLEESAGITEVALAHKVMCAAMHTRLCTEMGTDFLATRFIPYIQFHEIEALLFVKPEVTAEILGMASKAADLHAAVHECGGCEEINDGPSTAPSKRISKVFPHYKKGGSINAHLPRVCSKVGLSDLRAACPLFNEWISRL